MSSKVPFVAVLDQQFHIHTYLGGGRYTRVYKATHNTGVDVVIKFVLKADGFFEELSRLYATDDSLYFCSCLFNYPPLKFSEAPLPLDRPAEELFQSSGVAAADCDWDQVGILVLEYIDGRPLVEEWAGFSEMAKTNVLLEVAYALEELHQSGECHGDLSHANVLIERENHEIKIIDFGHNPLAASQDMAEGERALMAGCGADMSMFARNFLSQLRWPGWKMRRFASRCRRAPLEVRPTAVDAQRQLKLVRKRLSPKRNLEILYSFFRPVNLACWVGLVFGSTFLISNMRNKPINQRRADLLSNTKMAPAKKVDAFRELLTKAPDKHIRELIVDDIATHSDLEHPKLMNGLDAIKPIAVFAFRKDPLVIGRDEVYRLGDWVRVGEGTEDEQFGYIAAIEFNRIKIVYEGAYSWRFFDRPNFFIGVAISSEVALVWDNERNVDRLLEVTSGLNGMDYISENDKNLQSGGGKTAGLFLAHSAESFLKTLSSQVPIEINRNKVILKERVNDIPVYAKFPKLQLEDYAIGNLEGLLSDFLDNPVVVDEAIQNQRITTELFNITWQELLAALELRSEIQTINGEKTLYITK